MTVSSTHTKNTVLGWDISATAKADKDEKISRAQIIVNGSSRYDRTFDPPISNWSATLNQQGQFPGDNSVKVIVTSDKGDETESDDSWS